MLEEQLSDPAVISCCRLGFYSGSHWEPEGLGSPILGGQAFEPNWLTTSRSLADGNPGSASAHAAFTTMQILGPGSPGRGSQCNTRPCSQGRWRQGFFPFLLGSLSFPLAWVLLMLILRVCSFAACLHDLHDSHLCTIILKRPLRSSTCTMSRCGQTGSRLTENGTTRSLPSLHGTGQQMQDKCTTRQCLYLPHGLL